MALNISNVFTKHERGSCPYCNGIVRMIESNLDESILDKDGNIVTTNNISYTCIGYCMSCDKPVYIDPTGSGFVTIPYTDTAIYLHNSIKRILGDKQGVLKTDIPITIQVPDNEFTK